MRLAVVITLFVGAFGLFGNAQEFGPPGLALFDPAPEIDLRFVKGKPITLEEGRGEKVFIIEYWATWCAPCKVTIPHLTKLQNKYRDDGLVIIGISDETVEQVQPFVAKMGDTMDYRVAVDPESKTKNQYTEPFKVKSIPHAFVVDKAGRLMWHGHPADQILEPLIEALLEEKVDTADGETPDDEGEHSSPDDAEHDAP